MRDDMISYYSINEQGGREYQEDSVGVYLSKKQAVFLVADGLGGHGKGDVASSFIIKHALQQLKQGIQPEEYFQKTYVDGNKGLTDIQDKERLPNSIKTTLVCCLISDNRIAGAHIGDSRFYLFKDDKLTYRSKDHSVPQVLALSGEIKEEEIRRHPDRNKVLRALGNRDRAPEYQQHGPWKVQRGIRILLCTDGFWEYVEEKDMQRTLKKAKNVEHWMKSMSRLAAKRDRSQKQDNFSAVGIWIC